MLLLLPPPPKPPLLLLLLGPKALPSSWSVGGARGHAAGCRAPEGSVGAASAG